MQLSDGEWGYTSDAKAALLLSRIRIRPISSVSDTRSVDSTNSLWEEQPNNRDQHYLRDEHYRLRMSAVAERASLRLMFISQVDTCIPIQARMSTHKNRDLHLFPSRPSTPCPPQDQKSSCPRLIRFDRKDRLSGQTDLSSMSHVLDLV